MAMDNGPVGEAVADTGRFELRGNEAANGSHENQCGTISEFCAPLSAVGLLLAFYARNGLCRVSLRERLMTRFILAGILVLLFPASVGAQGTRDPSNFGAMAQPRSPLANEQSRPTAIQNVPNNQLPSNSGVQRIYRDGRLQSILR